MLEFFRAGGFVMFFVLAFGVLTLGVAARYAFEPREHHTAMIRALSASTVFSVLCGTAANLATVFATVSQNDEWRHSPDMPFIVMMGIAESLTPAMLGFSLLSLAWLVTAAGVRRSTVA